MTESENHKKLKRKIAKKYEKRGFKTVVEYTLGNNKTVDVYAKKDGEKIGIEVGSLNGKKREKKLERYLDKIIHYPQLGKVYQRSSNDGCSRVKINFEESIREKAGQYSRDKGLRLTRTYNDLIKKGLWMEGYLDGEKQDGSG